jgi:hypothetical protein
MGNHRPSALIMAASCSELGFVMEPSSLPLAAMVFLKYFL